MLMYVYGITIPHGFVGAPIKTFSANETIELLANDPFQLRIIK